MSAKELKVKVKNYFDKKMNEEFQRMFGEPQYNLSEEKVGIRANFFIYSNVNGGEIIMADVTVQKRGEVYQYKFEIASIDGKRKFKNKSGFATKSEAKQAGIIAYNEYLNTGHSLNLKQCHILIILITG